MGDIIEIQGGMRIPTDMILLWTLDDECFIKTDQLDGETDWKFINPVKKIFLYIFCEFFPIKKIL